MTASFIWEVTGSQKTFNLQERSDKMNFIKIEQFDTANGVGVGTVLWVAGCNHHCPCCHNPQTWDEHAGKLWEPRHLDYLLKTLEPEYITRLTLSGGDPLYPANRSEVSNIIAAVGSVYPDKFVWLYTGYDWDTIQDISFIQNKQVDVVVDGEFKIQMKDLNLPYRGSANQHLIGVTPRGTQILQPYI